MDKKTVNILLSIAAAGLFIAGLVFLCITIFADGSKSMNAALFCILLGSMFIIIRSLYNKKDE